MVSDDILSVSGGNSLTIDSVWAYQGKWMGRFEFEGLGISYIPEKSNALYSSLSQSPPPPFLNKSSFDLKVKLENSKTYIKNRGTFESRSISIALGLYLWITV